MKIFVKAKAGSKENKVIPPPLKLWASEVVSNKPERKDEYYVVYVKEPPVQGKANKAIAKLLADHFGIPSSGVVLMSGETSKIKVFEVDVEK